MRINVTRYEQGLSIFFFQQLQWFLQLRNCFILWYKKERSIKLRPLTTWHGSLFDGNFQFTSCLTWNKKKRKQTLESVQYELEIIFNQVTLKLLIILNLSVQLSAQETFNYCISLLACLSLLYMFFLIFLTVTTTIQIYNTFKPL